MSASTSNIYLNGYQFPSISSTGSIGQALILGSNNVVSWQNVSSNFAYNNPNISTIAVGGVPSGISFSNISVTDLFNKMFYPNIAPFIYSFTITYTGVSGIKTPGDFYTMTTNNSGGTGIEIGSLIGSITYSVSIIPKSLPVSIAVLTGSNGGSDSGKIQSSLLPNLDPLSVSGTISNVPNPNNTTYTYTFYVKDNSGVTSSNILSTNIQSYYPYYYYRSTVNYYNQYNMLASWISAGGTFSKVVINTSSVTNVTGFSYPNGEYLYLAIPGSLKTGNFTNINYPNDNSSMADFFYHSQVTISSSTFWNNVTYYIYISKSTKTNTLNASQGYSFS